MFPRQTSALILAAAAFLFNLTAAAPCSLASETEYDPNARDTVGGRFQIVPRPSEFLFDIMLNDRVLDSGDFLGVHIIGSYQGLDDPVSAKDRIEVLEYDFSGNACWGYIEIFTIAPTGQVSISEPIAECSREDLDRIERLGEDAFAFVFAADVYHAPDIYIYDHGSISEPVTVAPMQRSIDTAAGRLYMRARSGAVDLLLNGNPLTAIGGLGLHLVGAHPADATRLAVFGVEWGVRSCHYMWRVAEFTEAGGAHFSEPFAECRNDPNIVFPPKGGVLIGFEAWGKEPAMVFRYKNWSLQQVR